MAAEIVNLNKARKTRIRAADARQAAENRRKFGRSKTEKAAERAERERAAKAREGARLDAE